MFPSPTRFIAAEQGPLSAFPRSAALGAGRPGGRLRLPHGTIPQQGYVSPCEPTLWVGLTRRRFAPLVVGPFPCSLPAAAPVPRLCAFGHSALLEPYTS